MSLKERSISSAGWSVVSSWIATFIQFARLVFLSRWLTVENFGIYALASSIVLLSSKLVDFGMAGAFMHRSPDTEDESKAAAVQLSLRMLFNLVWLSIMIPSTLLFSSGDLRTALLVLTVVTAFMHINTMPNLILMRRVTQQRTAVIRVAIVLIATPIMLQMAWYGYGIWSLLALNIVTLFVNFAALYLWKPVWRAYFAWDRTTVSYFLNYGYQNFIGVFLYDVLDRIDDIWVGKYLGSVPLGFYSRAYSFATYPRTIFALPVNWIIGGTYAELKGDRQRLSKVFYWSNALLIRSGFLLAGLLALIAPEFIALLLGEKWMPMLTIFRLMLVFTLFDPIKVSLSSLISLAGGKPRQVAQARMIQLVVLVAGLYTLGFAYGAEGVALAVDIMLVIGIGLLFWRSREYVDVSLRDLFAAPGIALLAALGLGYTAAFFLPNSQMLFSSMILKALLYTAGYLLTLYGLDREFLHTVFQEGALNFQRSRRLKSDNI